MVLIRKAKTLSRIIKKRTKSVFANEIYTDSYKHAYSVLFDYSPMPYTSSLCRHNWGKPEYDLTIIIPVYNSEKWIKECLESAVNQETNFDYEVIVVNDGSTDNTKQIVDSFSGCGKLKIIHQENKGYSGARNVAIRMINSDYIMFLDSDDYLTPDAVEKLLSVAKANDADIVEGNGFTFNSNGRIAPVKDDINTLWGGPCLKVMRSSLWQNIEFPENYIYEDTIISYLIGKLSKKTLFIPDELYAYRIHEDSVTQKRDKNPKRVDSFWILQLVLDEQIQLGIVNDSLDDYRHVMRHVIITYRRTEMLPDEIKKSIFVLTKELLKDCYIDVDYKNQINKLAKVIKSDNYGKYCAICDTINLGKV